MSHPKARLTSDGPADRAVDAFFLEILAGGEDLVSVVLSLVCFLVFFFLALSIVPQELCSGCACSRILEEILGASFVLSHNLAASGC